MGKTRYEYHRPHLNRPHKEGNRGVLAASENTKEEFDVQDIAKKIGEPSIRYIMGIVREHPEIIDQIITDAVLEVIIRFLLCQMSDYVEFMKRPICELTDNQAVIRKMVPGIQKDYYNDFLRYEALAKKRKMEFVEEDYICEIKRQVCRIIGISSVCRQGRICRRLMSRQLKARNA